MWQKSPMTFVTIILLQKSLETHLSGVEFYVVYRTDKTCSLIKIMYNEKLSENRAKSVKEYIQQKTFLKDEKIITRFFASTRPIASNNTEEGRQKNRRVEVYLYSHY